MELQRGHVAVGAELLIGPLLPARFIYAETWPASLSGRRVNWELIGRATFATASISIALDLMAPVQRAAPADD